MSEKLTAKIPKDNPKRPFSELDKEFMRMMTEITGCGFIDVTPEKNEVGKPDICAID